MMKTYRIGIEDPMNPWVHAIEVYAESEAQAFRRVGSYLFARVSTGEAKGLVHLTLLKDDDGTTGR